MRRFARLLSLACLVLLLAATAFAAPQQERRVALVIGNGAYKAGPLKNPVNDARDMASTLRSLGFEVILRENAGLAQMEQAVDQFWASLRKGGTGLFFFAGHGLQVKGVNYLVPVDANIQLEQDVKVRCLDVNLVLGRMENAGNSLNLVILDACRNNPFARAWRNAGQGLAKMDAPMGTLIAYATSPDSVAADGAGKNGVYTSHLLQRMRTPGLKVEDVLKQTRIGVIRDTDKRQIPWESSSLTGDFYFAGAGQGPSGQGGPQPQPMQQLAMAPAPKQAPSAAAGVGQSGNQAAQFAQLARGSFPEARDFFTRAAGGPYDAEAMAGLALAHFFEGSDSNAQLLAQRLGEDGLQSPHVRLARGLALGMEDREEADYQLYRANTEGADRALSLLCLSAVRVKRRQFDKAEASLKEYAALVPEADRAPFVAELRRRLELKARLLGAYSFVWARNNQNFGCADVKFLIRFSLVDGRLTADSNELYRCNAKVLSISRVRIEDRTLRFVIETPGLFSQCNINMNVDLSNGTDNAPGIWEACVAGTEAFRMIREPDPRGQEDKSQR